MREPVIPYVILAVLFFCLWQSWALFAGWAISPYDSLDWLPFIIWSMPLFWRKGSKGWVLPALALALSVSGTLLELNVLKYAGLAFILGWLAPASPFLPVWLAAAATWMPWISYLFVAYPFPLVIAGKVIIAGAASYLMIRSSRDVE